MTAAPSFSFTARLIEALTPPAVYKIYLRPALPQGTAQSTC